MCKNVRYADVESAIPCRSVPLSRSPSFFLCSYMFYIYWYPGSGIALYSSAPTLTVVRYDSEHVHTHRHALTHMYTYIATRARAFTRPRRIAADTHAFCNETVQITAARTAMHVIMNAGRLFVSVPSAGNIGHFEFSIFNALVSPFGPLLLSHRPFPPLALPLARVLPPVGCCCRRTPPPPLGRVHVALVYERAPSALVHYMVGHIVVFGEISSHFGRYLCMRGSGRGVSFH